MTRKRSLLWAVVLGLLLCRGPLLAQPFTNTPWSAVGGQSGAHLGWSVAGGDVNGDGYADTITGMRQHGPGGRVAAFHGSPTGPSGTPDWTADAPVPGSFFNFGHSVATGDVNGDGFDDVIVGAPSGRFNGAAYIYHGSATGLSATPAWSVEELAFPGETRLGYSVAAVGDINNDGFDDVLVGDPLHSGTGARVLLYLGSPTGVFATPVWTGIAPQAASFYGWSVAGAGDVNGDDLDDFVVGAMTHANTISEEGAAFVYHGTATGIPGPAAWSAFGGVADAEFGRAVAGAGDVNNDGFDDVIIGAQYFQEGTAGGKAFVFLGSSTGLAATAAWSAMPNTAFANFGQSVASAGDVNADGYDDVIVGAPWMPTSAGQAFLYLGSATGLSTMHDWSVHGPSASHLGWSVAAAGDTNLDGVDDVVIGAYALTQTESFEGAAYVYFGIPRHDFIRGDANADLLFDISDGIYTLSYLFAGGPAGCLAALDVNDDDSVDLADAILNLGAIFGTGAPPVAPFPSCGPDSTLGVTGCATFDACP